MTKKKSISNSDPTINLRLPQELKNKIQMSAEKKNLTISKYLRELLENVYGGTYCKKEIEKDKVESFLFSRDFLQLIVWMQSKKSEEKKVETDEDLNRYIKTLKVVDGYMPDNLKAEFDKVLQDVLRVRNEDARYSSSSFKFMVSYNEAERFNIKGLEQFLLNDGLLNRFVHMKALSPKELSDFVIFGKNKDLR